MRWEKEISELYFWPVVAGHSRVVVMQRPESREQIVTGDELLLVEVEVGRSMRTERTGRALLVKICWISQSLPGLARNYLVLEVEKGTNDIEIINQ